MYTTGKRLTNVGEMVGAELGVDGPSRSEVDGTVETAD